MDDRLRRPPRLLPARPRDGRVVPISIILRCGRQPRRRDRRQENLGKLTLRTVTSQGASVCCTYGWGGPAGRDARAAFDILTLGAYFAHEIWYEYTGTKNCSDLTLAGWDSGLIDGNGNRRASWIVFSGQNFQNALFDEPKSGPNSSCRSREHPKHLSPDCRRVGTEVAQHLCRDAVILA
jgi:hypothetical protein